MLKINYEVDGRGFGTISPEVEIDFFRQNILTTAPPLTQKLEADGYEVVITTNPLRTPKRKEIVFSAADVKKAREDARHTPTLMRSFQAKGSLATFDEGPPEIGWGAAWTECAQK